MKNKLTPEEQLFQSKLNDADFSYKESHWTEMQDKLGANTTATFSPLLKAAIGFVVLVGAVAVINLNYTTENTEISNNTKQIKENQQIEKLTREETKFEAEFLDQEEANEVEKHPVQPEEKTEVTSEPFTLVGKMEKATIKSNDQNSKTNPQPIKQETVLPESTTSNYNFEITAIDILSPACLNSKINFKGNISGNVPEGVKYQWFMEGKQINGNELFTSISSINSGIKKITLKAFVNSELVSSQSTIIEIHNAPDLSFKAIDSKDLFTDNQISLSVLHPTEGTYQWKATGATIPQGENSTLIFDSEGYKEITLEHTSAEGCVTASTQSVEMNIDFKTDYPNIFTPDNNGVNEEFELIMFENLDLKSYELNIFNLNGKLVFSTKDQTKGWNGKLNNVGPMQPKGTYAWIVDLENKEGIKKRFKDKFKLGL